MANSADPDQLPTDLGLQCLQSQTYMGSAGHRVKVLITTAADNVFKYI